MQSTKQPDNKTTRQQNNQTTKQPDSTNVLIILFFRIRMTIEENGQQSKTVFLYFFVSPSILPNQQKPLCQRLLPLVINARLNDNQRHLSNPSWMMEKVFAIRALVSLYSGEVG